MARLGFLWIAMGSTLLAACSIINSPDEVKPGGGAGAAGGTGANGPTTGSAGSPTSTGPGGDGGGGGGPAVCGNGKLEGDEACDDGNSEDGDACSKDCAITEFDVEADPTVGNEWPGIGTSGVDGGKGFFVVWRYRGSEADPDDDQIRGRAYTASGDRVTNQAAKLSTTSGPGQARIGTNRDGVSIVTWQSASEANIVRYRAILADGTTASSSDDTIVGSNASGLISVGASAGGELALLWLQFDGTNTNAMLRGFDKNGSNFVTSNQSLGIAANNFDYPGIWGVKDGFVASWSTAGGNLGSVKLGSDGIPEPPQFNLATGGTDTDPNRNPFGAYVGPADQFIAVYEAPVDIGGIKNRIMKRPFSSPGNSAEVGAVVSSVHHYESNSRVAHYTNGHFVVVWTDNEPGGEPTDYCQVMARVFAQDGTPLGAEFQVNQVVDGCQSWPGVAVNSDGDAMFVWDNNISPIPYHISSVIYPRLLAK